jgi:hypothetical protein
MKTRSILVFLVSSLLATTLLQVAQAKEISISSVSDGTYSFGLGYPSDLSPDYYFDFRKKGNKVVGIKYTKGGFGDTPVEGEHYWERVCIEGTIVGNKIIGTGVIIETEDRPGKMSKNSLDEGLIDTYKIAMTNRRVASSKKIREYPGHFAVGNIYYKATLTFYPYDPASGRSRSFSKIDSQRIPATCQSLLKNTFSKKYSGRA